MGRRCSFNSLMPEFDTNLIQFHHFVTIIAFFESFCFENYDKDMVAVRTCEWVLIVQSVGRPLSCHRVPIGV